MQHGLADPPVLRKTHQKEAKEWNNSINENVSLMKPNNLLFSLRNKSFGQANYITRAALHYLNALSMSIVVGPQLRLLKRKPFLRRSKETVATDFSSYRLKEMLTGAERGLEIARRPVGSSLPAAVQLHGRNHSIESRSGVFDWQLPSAKATPSLWQQRQVDQSFISDYCRCQLICHQSEREKLFSALFLFLILSCLPLLGYRPW